MTRVLFIAGCWRSGSTLLGDLLGAIPGFCHVGELHHVWRRGLELDWLCGCGEPFRSCPFWARAVAEWGEEAKAAELDALRRRIAKETPSDATPEMMRAMFPQYVDSLGRLVEAVSSVSGGRMLVDSTKNARHAYTLLASGRVDLRVVHLIRDPRATVFSLVRRPKPHLDDPKNSPMLQPSVPEALQLWLRRNREAELLTKLLGDAVTLRYEDFARDPGAALGRALRLAGVERAAGAEYIGGGPIPPSHTIAGNPDRLNPGSRSRIVLDDEWSREMNPALRGFVERMTRDWMKKYGYV
jgi:hypothetical protein